MRLETEEQFLTSSKVYEIWSNLSKLPLGESNSKLNFQEELKQLIQEMPFKDVEQFILKITLSLDQLLLTTNLKLQQRQAEINQLTISTKYQESMIDYKKNKGMIILLLKLFISFFFQQLYLSSPQKIVLLRTRKNCIWSPQEQVLHYRSYKTSENNFQSKDQKKDVLQLEKITRQMLGKTIKSLLKNVSFSFKKSDILRRNFQQTKNMLNMLIENQKEWLCGIISQFRSGGQNRK